MRRFLPVLLITALAVFGTVLAGCGKGNFSQKASEGKENVFRYPIPTKPTTLDPALVQDGDTIDLLQQVYEGLVAWGEDNQVKPNLAESWTVSDDGRIYTFKLKPGVKFHNGREVTAEDFKWSIERACQPSLTTGMAGNYLNDIVGVNEMLAGSAKEVSGIRVVDPQTLEITIDKPRPYFLGKLTYPVSFVVAKESVPADKEITDVKQMVGTGPFKAASYTENQLFVLDAFADYHAGAPKIAKIERPVMTDAAARLNRYRSGELDLLQLERQDVAGLQKDEKLKDQIEFFNRPAVWYIGFNVKEVKEFADPRVRRAIAMAIDRDRIVNEILGGVNQKADTIVPPGVFGHREKATLPGYDVEAAKRLLAEAGFPNGQGFPTLPLTYRAGRPDARLVSEAVANMLQTNLGIKVTPQETEWGAMLEQVNAKKAKFVHMRWSADYLDPQNFLSLMLTTTGNENKLNYSNAEVDRLCAEADVHPDPERRKALYAQAEDILLREGPWVPIYFQRDAELISPRVKGLRESLFGHLPHTTVELSK